MVTGYDLAEAITPFSLPPADSLVAGISANVAAEISRSKQLQPDLRYRSVREMRPALLVPTKLMAPGDGRSAHATTSETSTTAAVIRSVPVSGGQATRILSGENAGRPSWSSSGWIAFNSNRGIEVVSEDGQIRRVLINGDQNWAPVWAQ